jgi:hypothetical protein
LIGNAKQVGLFANLVVSFLLPGIWLVIFLLIPGRDSSDYFLFEAAFFLWGGLFLLFSYFYVDLFFASKGVSWIFNHLSFPRGRAMMLALALVFIFYSVLTVCAGAFSHRI